MCQDWTLSSCWLLLDASARLRGLLRFILVPSGRAIRTTQVHQSSSHLIFRKALLFPDLINSTVSVGVMKALDITLRRHALPKYTASSVPPSPWLLALLLLTEYRYESFTPNRIRVPREGENFSEPTQLALNTGAFLLLQLLPQDIPTIVAFEVLLAIYINCTGWQLLLRYKNSPSLFGPLYLADSLTGFWRYINPTPDRLTLCPLTNREVIHGTTPLPHSVRAWRIDRHETSSHDMGFLLSLQGASGSLSRSC